MARQTLRDAVDRIAARIWDAGAETALMWAGYDALDAERLVRSGKDPILRADREYSHRLQQRLAREELHRVLESLLVEATRQLSFEQAS